MPITTSAKKALRGSRRKREVNLRQKKAMTDAVKKLRKFIANKDAKGAQELLPQLQQALDKSAKRGIIKQNTASRKKSRFIKMVRSIA